MGLFFKNYWLGPGDSPSAVTMVRNTRVLSIRPRNCSAPGPIAVSTTSSAAWTPALTLKGRLPARRIAPGTPQFFSFAT